MCGQHLDSWLVLNEGVNHTVQNFKTQVNLFKADILSEEDYYDQMDFLCNIKKPREMNPGKFLLYLKMQNKLLAELPSAPADNPGFSDMELRRIFLQAMPKHWQEKFADADKTIRDTDLKQMRSYFDRQCVKDPFIKRRTDDSSSHTSATQGNHHNT